MVARPVGGLSFPRTGFHPLSGRTILQIIPELEAGGAERTAVDIAAGLAKVGARAVVATEGVALIHARSRAPAWVGLGAARALNLPFVTTFHGSYAGGSSVKILYNSVMTRGDAVIANSHYTAGLVRSLSPQASERIRVIHRGTDFAKFSPSAVGPDRVEALRKAWGVAPHERIVLLAARLTGWKGQKVLIEAAGKLNGEGLADVAFVLAGDAQGRDSYVRELDQLIESNGLTGVVRRVGHCEDMPAAFLAASVVTVPSTEPEAFGRSAVEAQAMGAPVVVSDLGAVPETVLTPPEVSAQERTGWRVPAGDAAALSQALAAALAMGASAREAMATRARLHVERHFSLERMVEDTLDVYISLLEVRAKAPAS